MPTIVSPAVVNRAWFGRSEPTGDQGVSSIQTQVRVRSAEMARSGLDPLEQEIALIQQFGSNFDGNTGAHFSSPAEAADFAKMMNANLQSSIGQYVGAVQAVKPERLELLRQQFGEDFVTDYIRRNKEDFNAAKSLLEADQAIIGKAFNVFGKLVEWGEDGLPKLGHFALSGHGLFAEGPKGPTAGASTAAGSLGFKLIDYQAEADVAAQKVRETKGLGIDKLA